MRRCVALLTAACLALPVGARAQEKEPEEAEPEAPPPSEWPDAGSEEPEGAKVFPIEPTEKRYSTEVEVEVPKEVGEPTYRWSWYGWRCLIGDGVSVILMIAAAFSERFEVAIAGAAVYGIAGPVAHFTAGNWGRALISFGVRIAGPAIFGLGTFAITNAIESDDDTAAILTIAGVFAGAFIAAGLDVGLVARSKIPVEPKVTLAPNGVKTFGLAVAF